jgi:hypothetical protein
MAVQTSYGRRDVAFAGLLADTSTYESDSYAAQVDLEFGIAVTRSTNGRITKPSAASDVIVGITHHTHQKETYSLAGDLGIPAEDTAPVLRRGRVMVKVEEAVVDGDDAWVRFTADTGKPAGGFRKSNDANKARRLRGAVFRSSADANGFAVLEVNCLLDEAPRAVELMTLAHAQLTDNLTSFAFMVPADRYFVLTEGSIYNATGLAAHGSNSFAIEFRRGATSMASWDTATGADGSIPAGEKVVMANAAIANRVCPPGTVVTAVFTEAGTATLPAGTVQAAGYFI